MSCAVFHGGFRLFEGRVGVPDGNENIGSAPQRVDEVQAALHFRSKGDDADNVGKIEHKARIGQKDVFPALRALARGVDKRPFGVYAENFRAVPRGRAALLPQRADIIERCAELLLGDGHRRGKPAGDAVAGDAARHNAHALGARIGSVLAHIAVNVKIDKPRRDVLPRRVDHGAARRQRVRRAQADDLFIEEQRLTGYNLIGHDDTPVYDGLHESTSRVFADGKRQHKNYPE